MIKSSSSTAEKVARGAAPAPSLLPPHYLEPAELLGGPAAAAQAAPAAAELLGGPAAAAEAAVPPAVAAAVLVVAAAPADVSTFHLELDADQFWYPRHMLIALGRHVEDGVWNIKGMAERGFFGRFPFFELPPVGSTSTLKLPTYLGYHLTPFTPSYYVNHYAKLDEAPNVEFQDRGTLTRNHCCETELCKPSRCCRGSSSFRRT